MRDRTNGVTAITNYFREESGGAKDPRYASMVKAAGSGTLGAADLQGILASTALRDMNVQAVILEPATRGAYVARGRGKRPVARGVWQRLDLSPWLGPETNPVTPASVMVTGRPR